MQHDKRGSLGVHPQKFLLWLFLATVIMLFAAFTSAYIVRMADGTGKVPGEAGFWQSFEIPFNFIASTIVIVVSSVFMQWAVFSAKRDNQPQLRIALVLTLLAGLAFVGSQFLGWRTLTHEQEVYFAGSASNASGSFFYVITGVHLLHLLSAIIFLGVVVANAFSGRIHSNNTLQISICNTYWHFLGGLWLYLFFFLMYFRG